MPATEKIKYAAILFYEENESPKIFTGKNHASIIQDFAKMNIAKNKRTYEFQGFLTTNHRFVDRKEALTIAKNNNQIKEKHRPFDQLLSEDLYDDNDDKNESSDTLIYIPDNEIIKYWITDFYKAELYRSKEEIKDILEKAYPEESKNPNFTINIENMSQTKVFNKCNSLIRYMEFLEEMFKSIDNNADHKIDIYDCIFIFPEVKNMLIDRLKNEINEAYGSISNERLWETGYTTDEYNPHTQNIVNFYGYISELNEMIRYFSSLSNNL